MKKVFVMSVTLVFLTYFFSIIAFAEDETANFRTTIENIFNSWRASNLNEDFDLWFSNWDENAIKMASNKATIYGKSAIGNMKRKMFQTWAFESWDVEIDEVQLSGDLGYARGTYIVNLKSKAESTSTVLEGTFLTIFKKQADGSWKIYRDCMMSK